MARLRLLFALLLIAVGTTFGAFALSGYYEPHIMNSPPVVASVGRSSSQETSQFLRLHARQRFVAIEPQATAPAVKPKPPKSAAKPAIINKRPQKTAVQWPWSLFGN